MPYFPVDDQATFHPKIVAAGNASTGVWTRAGAWCKAHVSGGFVPTNVAYAIGSKVEVKRLVTVGLWIAVEGGFRYHDWEHQAGNFDADEERARRESVREKDRIRKQRQRERERSERDMSQGHAGSHARTPAGIPSTPSPSPLTTDRSTSPVPYRESYPQGPDEPESIEVLCSRQALALGVDFAKVKTAIGKACGRFPDPTAVMRIIATVLERAKPPVKSPTGVVLTAVRNDWAEWQQFLDEDAA